METLQLFRLPKQIPIKWKNRMLMERSKRYWWLCTITTAHSELQAGINIWIKDWIFSYHLLQRKLNFIASPQLYAALNSYTSLMVGRGEVSLFSGIHSACVACVYNCVVRSIANTVDVYCTCYSKYFGWAAHNTVVNTGNTGRMNPAEQTHLTSSNH